MPSVLEEAPVPDAALSTLHHAIFALVGLASFPRRVAPAILCRVLSVVGFENLVHGRTRRPLNVVFESASRRSSSI